MKKSGFTAFAFFCLVTLPAFLPAQNKQAPKVFPYATKGLSKEAAAAHLLNRFSFGIKPHEVEMVMSMGLENWFEQQLAGELSEDSLNSYLKDFEGLRMSNAEIVRAFPKPLQVMRMAIKDGVVAKDSIKLMDTAVYKKRIRDYIQSKGLKQQSDLIRQFISQRILRAVYARNQLKEVLTGFWFNHFNVSFTKQESVLLIPNYERDAIRPYVNGNFGEMLMATAKSPAMLMYLDNASSSGSPSSLAIPDVKGQDSLTAILRKRMAIPSKNQGLNENFAREVMELHTMGVDGGYTQADVTQAARILTGWSIYPFEEGYSPYLKRMLDGIGETELIPYGFVKEGDFMFAATRHDSKEKLVLGKTFPPNKGLEEGETLLQMLAHHPSTATFISKKLACFFVTDEPPKSLVNKMAKTFMEQNGNINAVLRTMVYAPEFWEKEAIRSKIKSPFELVISSIRALNAEVEIPYTLFNRIDRMGQRIYYYPAPTGFPDQAAYWINTGALLHRMNFGLDIAAQKIRGVSVNLLALNDYHEPESAEMALRTYAGLLLPGRDIETTISRLIPLLKNPALEAKISSASLKADNLKNVTGNKNQGNKKEDTPDEISEANKSKNKKAYSPAMLAQVVGILLGSPEFQRK
jgi:uncharacterized protein (DUF1800 family)